MKYVQPNKSVETSIYKNQDIEIMVSKSVISDLVSNSIVSKYDFVLYDNGVFKKKTTMGIPVLSNEKIEDYYEICINILLK